jgi:DHA1 family tetracycline resistance protein-like MFS transporter
MSSAETLRHPGTRRTRARAPLAILFATVFIDLLGFGIVIPFLPMYAERLRISAFEIGLILSSYSFTQLIAAPVLGRISDHVGRRPIIMIGLFGSSASYLIYAFARSFPMLLLSRVVHGACAATVSTAQAYIADTTSDEQRARGMGMIGAAFGLGFVVGPALGGVLGHSSLRTPALAAAAGTALNFVFAAIALPESHPPERSARLHWGDLTKPLLLLPAQLTRHRMARLFLIAFLATFAMALFETTFALIAPLVYGYDASGVGGLFAYAGLIQVITQGYLLGIIVKRAGETRLIRLGLLLFATGMAPLASVESRAMLFALLTALSLGYGLANPLIATLISKRTAHGLQGEVLGVNQSALALARIVGPVTAGFMYAATGPAATYIGGGIVGITALLLAGGLGRQPAGASPR